MEVSIININVSYTQVTPTGFSEFFLFLQFLKNNLLKTILMLKEHVLGCCILFPFTFFGEVTSSQSVTEQGVGRKAQAFSLAGVTPPGSTSSGAPLPSMMAKALSVLHHTSSFSSAQSCALSLPFKRFYF